MKMQNWLHARSAKLLEEINNTPYTDDSDDIKMRLIMAALRESSVEMFQRAAEKSRKEIEKINSIAMQKSISEVEDALVEEVAVENEVVKTEVTEGKTEVKLEEPKIKLSSSFIRRVDTH
ncbi:MAG: hypothetical protein GY781_16655 [Gammaproteobacteria bacterium]|nr:hypothetical protein [Gammaproteobacteria bacterium]